MKPVKNYILLVDAYRRPSRQRNTAGRYRVGAKTPQEAVKLLRDKIKFGSIQVYYCVDDTNSDPKNRQKVGYKEVVKEISCPHYQQIKPVSAIAPQKN